MSDYNNSLKQEPQDNLLSRADNLNGRLRDCSSRLEKCLDMLFGTSPKAAEAGGIPTTPNLMRHLDVAHSSVGDIESLLSRLENRL
jgi:hypothetical protein